MDFRNIRKAHPTSLFRKIESLNFFSDYGGLKMGSFNQPLNQYKNDKTKDPLGNFFPPLFSLELWKGMVQQIQMLFLLWNLSPLVDVNWVIDFYPLLSVQKEYQWLPGKDGVVVNWIFIWLICNPNLSTVWYPFGLVWLRVNFIWMWNV